MSEPVKEVSYRIHAYETDTQGILSIPALFNYLQDIAAWAIDAYPLDFRKCHRLKAAGLNFLSGSLYGDEVCVLVAETGENLFDHSVFRNNDGRELCRLRIEWIS
ncbi:MAG TPA: hypothetical protein VMW76_02230 [Bacteroidales bacterium]|nr:hypothetical protein [Bacteroidales bacterium]